jgi:purine-nucleoside phosphorylase|tara:strand:- start:22529 stop:23254 length:726 start_codon:yes stop_codon:yes gene_type:complete
VPTPHISAAEDDFASTVLMPGDPLRATYIAANFLTEAKQITNVRNMTGYTGMYKENPVSVMASGMGIPSAAIYVTELYRHYQVQNIIRIGTAGSFSTDLPLRSLVVAESCFTSSSMPSLLDPDADPILLPSSELLKASSKVAADKNMEVATGRVFTTDIFYEPNENLTMEMHAAGVVAVEMECAALYAIAQLEKRGALSLLTLTDQLATGESLSTDERQSSLDGMIDYALNIVDEVTLFTN